MKFRSATFVCMLVVSVAPVALTDEPENQQGNGTATELTPKAQAIVSELRASLPVDSEAIAMLDDILKGSSLDANDGWFPLAKAQTLFDWPYVSKQFDTDGNSAIERTEFSGDDADFQRLDRIADGRLTDADFDWQQHSLTPTPGLMMFFRCDQDGNGKVTQAEFSALFEQLGGSESGYLALDDLREQFILSPVGPREPRTDRPNASTLVEALKNQEIGSLQAGPNVGDMAPDFTLASLQGESVTLSQEIGEQPIVLIFGNFTCGPFRSQAGNIEKLYERYQGRAKFYLVYVREAHPSDGWWMQSNQRVGIDLAQPKDNSQRYKIAATCQQHLDLKIPFLIDHVDDQVGTVYSGMPNRLYVIDRAGKVVFKNGRGPFGFHPRQLEQALVLLLNQ